MRARVRDHQGGKSRIRQIQLQGGQHILIGYIPPPICFVLLDIRGGPDPSRFRLNVIGEITCARDTECLQYTPYVNHTRVYIANEEINYINKVTIPSGTQLTFGTKPFETTIMVISKRNATSQQLSRAKVQLTTKPPLNLVSRHSEKRLRAINFGYLPSPICDVVFDCRATHRGARVYDTNALIGTLYFDPVTEKGIFTPKATHTRILINGKEINYGKKAFVHPGTNFIIGEGQYQKRFTINSSLNIPSTKQYNPWNTGHCNCPSSRSQSAPQCGQVPIAVVRRNSYYMG